MARRDGGVSHRTSNGSPHAACRKGFVLPPAVGDASGALNANWGTGPAGGLAAVDNWSARFTGEVTFPTAGG